MRWLVSHGKNSSTGQTGNPTAAGIRARGRQEKWDCPKNARRYVKDVRLSVTNGTDFPGDFNKIQYDKLKQVHIEELGWRESRLIQELQSVSQAVDPHLGGDTFLPSTASYQSPIQPLWGHPAPPVTLNPWDHPILLFPQQLSQKPDSGCMTTIQNSGRESGVGQEFRPTHLGGPSMPGLMQKWTQSHFTKPQPDSKMPWEEFATLQM